MGKFKEMSTVKEDRVIELENALYAVINANDLAYAKEIAADVLEEDLDEYLEEEGLEELNFDDDKFILDEGFEDE